MSRRAGATQTEIANLASVIASGRHSPALLAELEKRERRLEEISDELLATDSRGIDARLKEIEAFVLSSLQNIQERLIGEVPRAKAELAKHCTEITLTPEGESYKLSGEWNLVGEVRSDGTGGPGSHHGATSPSLLIPFQIEVAA